VQQWCASVLVLRRTGGSWMLLHFTVPAGCFCWDWPSSGRATGAASRARLGHLADTHTGGQARSGSTFIRLSSQRTRTRRRSDIHDITSVQRRRGPRRPQRWPHHQASRPSRHSPWRAPSRPPPAPRLRPGGSQASPTCTLATPPCLWASTPATLAMRPRPHMSRPVMTTSGIGVPHMGFVMRQAIHH